MKLAGIDKQGPPVEPPRFGGPPSGDSSRNPEQQADSKPLANAPENGDGATHKSSLPDAQPPGDRGERHEEPGAAEAAAKAPEPTDRAPRARRKPDAALKSKVIGVSFTEAEYVAIKKGAGALGIKPTEYVRRATLLKPTEMLADIFLFWETRLDGSTRGKP